MTLAEKLALEAQAKHSRGVKEELQLGTNVGSQDSAWLGLDSLARPAPSDRSTLSGTLKAGDDWGLGDFSSFSTSTTSAAPPSTTIQTPLSHPQPQLKPAKLWDLQDFTSPPSSSAHSSRPSSQQKARQHSQLNPTKFNSTVLDFDITIQDDSTRAGSGLLDLDDGAADFNLGLAEQRKGLLDQDPDFNDTVDNRGGDDDILGMLSQPVEVVKAQTQPQVGFFLPLFWDLWILLFFACPVELFLQPHQS